MNILKESLTATQIKTLNSSPVLVLPGPGVDKAYLVHDVISSFNWGSVAFDATVSIFVTNDPTDTASYYKGAENLDSTSNKKTIGHITNDAAGDHVQANTPLYIVGDADSTVGNSTVDVYIIYSIIDL